MERPAITNLGNRSRSQAAAARWHSSSTSRRSWEPAPGFHVEVVEGQHRMAPRRQSVPDGGDPRVVLAGARPVRQQHGGAGSTPGKRPAAGYGPASPTDHHLSSHTFPWLHLSLPWRTGGLSRYRSPQ